MNGRTQFLRLLLVSAVVGIVFGEAARGRADATVEHSRRPVEEAADVGPHQLQLSGTRRKGRVFKILKFVLLHKLLCKLGLGLGCDFGGSFCLLGATCLSGICGKDYSCQQCSVDLDCDSNQFCDASGSCQPRQGASVGCASNSECLTGLCVSGLCGCVADAECQTVQPGFFCFYGVCAADSPHDDLPTYSALDSSVEQLGDSALQEPVVIVLETPPAPAAAAVHPILRPQTVVPTGGQTASNTHLFSFSINQNTPSLTHHSTPGFTAGEASGTVVVTGTREQANGAAANPSAVDAYPSYEEGDAAGSASPVIGAPSTAGSEIASAGTTIQRPVSSESGASSPDGSGSNPPTSLTVPSLDPFTIAGTRAPVAIPGAVGIGSEGAASGGSGGAGSSELGGAGSNRPDDGASGGSGDVGSIEVDRRPTGSQTASNTHLFSFSINQHTSSSTHHSTSGFTVGEASASPVIGGPFSEGSEIASAGTTGQRPVSSGSGANSPDGSGSNPLNPLTVSILGTFTTPGTGVPAAIPGAAGIGIDGAGSIGSGGAGSSSPDGTGGIGLGGAGSYGPDGAGSIGPDDAGSSSTDGASSIELSDTGSSSSDGAGNTAPDGIESDGGDGTFGASCSTNADCLSGLCVVGRCGDRRQTSPGCGTDQDCPTDSYCDPDRLFCRAQRPTGRPCLSHRQCASHLCTADVCTDSVPCSSSFDCRSVEVCSAGTCSPLPCPDSTWTGCGHRCYKLYQELSTWRHAAIACYLQGTESRLVAPADTTDLECVRQVAAGEPFLKSGYHVSRLLGEWLDTLGVPLGRVGGVLWQDGAPSTEHVGQCSELYLQPDGSYRLVDNVCNEKEPYMCQMDF